MLQAPTGQPPREWTEQEKLDVQAAMRRIVEREKPLDENWMRVGPNTDAAIWRPWGRETGEL